MRFTVTSSWAAPAHPAGQHGRIGPTSGGYLPPDSQQLIALLMADPPLSYAEISVRLDIPIGSIGPTRNRCLDELNRHPAIAALIDTDSSAAAKCHPSAAVD